MPAAQIRISKRQLQTALAILLVVLISAALVISYPWLQLQLAQRLLQTGNYQQAEQILARLVESRPHWTKPRHKLVISQLHQGKSTQAAATVISLADHGKLDDYELAILFMDVAEQLVNTGHGEAALELADRILAEQDNEILRQAVIEISLLAARVYDLPLALAAVDQVLDLAAGNWMLIRSAFDLLLSKALTAEPNHAEPALDRALAIFPGNIIAITQKANLLGARQGPKAALDFLAEKEQNLILANVNQEYLATKRKLMLQLVASNPEAELQPYITGLPQDVVIELALQGLLHSQRLGYSGHQFFALADTTPQVVYAYAHNLYQLGRWEEAAQTFGQLRQLDPELLDYNAVNSALAAQTTTTHSQFYTRGYVDMAQLSPDGNYLAYRNWAAPPWSDEDLIAELIIHNFNTGQRRTLGDALLFSWSHNSQHLAYISMSNTGVGRLNIYTPATHTWYFFPREYDVVDFNWTNRGLMVQAFYQEELVLVSLSTDPDWQVSEPIPWQHSPPVNQHLAWLSLGDSHLEVHRPQHQSRVPLDYAPVFISSWSPDGRMAIVEDQRGKSWLYDHTSNRLIASGPKGTFAGWGNNHDIFWFLPVWDRLHVLVKLDASGAIAEYLPYAFDTLHYDLSIAADGSTLVVIKDDKLFISRR